MSSAAGMHAATAAPTFSRVRALVAGVVSAELHGHLELHPEVLEAAEADPRGRAVYHAGEDRPASGWSTPTISCMALGVSAIL
jgi:hypothetical protein